jgi:hypothetical protein
MSGKGIFPHRTPYPFVQFVNSDASLPVPTSPGADVTLPAIKGGGAIKKIQISGTISMNASADVVTVTCLRNGTDQIGNQFLVGDTVISGVRSQAFGFHWIDDEPGDSPVYTINFVSGVGGVSQVTASTASVENI